MAEMVFGMSGQIGSGKSTIARALAESVGCSTASFGGYVRYVARSLGYDENRATLQQLGADLVRDPETFCFNMLAQQVPDFVPGQRLVIDGIRHIRIANVLEVLVRPSRFVLVYMSVDYRVRLQRLQTREFDLTHLRTLDAHSTEHDVTARLRGRADITLVTTRPSGELVRAVRQWQRTENQLMNKGAVQ